MTDCRETLDAFLRSWSKRDWPEAAALTLASFRDVAEDPAGTICAALGRLEPREWRIRSELGSGKNAHRFVVAARFAVRYGDAHEFDADIHPVVVYRDGAWTIDPVSVLRMTNRVRIFPTLPDPAGGANVRCD